MTAPNVTVVGIVGAGTMGAGIAQVALEAGDRVAMCDQAPEVHNDGHSCGKGQTPETLPTASANQTAR